MADADITARCAAISRAVRGDGDLDEAVAELLALPAGLPVRGPLAAGLIDRILRSGTMPEPERLRHLDALLALADQNPPSDPDWERRRSGARSVALMLAAAEGRIGDSRAALAELDTLAEGPGGATMTDLSRMVVRYMQAVHQGDESAGTTTTGDAVACAWAKASLTSCSWRVASSEPK